MHRASRRSGYTLVEILIALAIIAVIVGASTPALRGWSELAQLREPADALAALARQARAQAQAKNQTYWIVLEPAGFALRDTLPGSPKDNVEHYALPEGSAYEVQSWEDREWSPARNRVWIFAPGDLSEPRSFRFQRGNQVLTQRYDPLTAQVVDEKIYVP